MSTPLLQKPIETRTIFGTTVFYKCRYIKYQDMANILLSLQQEGLTGSDINHVMKCVERLCEELQNYDIGYVQQKNMAYILMKKKYPKTLDYVVKRFSRDSEHHTNPTITSNKGLMFAKIFDVIKQ